MNFKKLTQISALSTIIIGSGITLVSCSVGSFEQTYDGKIKILLGWRKEDTQLQIINELVNVYNKTQKDTKDYLNVEIVNDEMGYGKLSNVLASGLRTKDAANFFNLVLHFPAALATINSYDQSLRFDVNEENKDDWGIDKSVFEPDFLAINDKVGGLKPNGLYAIPFTKSTAVNAVNGPILYYALETMISFGAKLNPNDQEWYDELKIRSANDLNYVKQLWGAPVQSERSKYQGMIINKDDIFYYGIELIDFAIRVQQLFENSHNKPQGELHFLGVNDMYNFISLLHFSMSAKKKNDYSGFFTKLNDKGYVDYSPYGDPNSQAYKDFVKITEKVLEAAKIGAFYVKNRAPAFLLRQHTIGAAIAATSSYEANFFPADSTADKYSFKTTTNGKENDYEIPFLNIFNLDLPNKSNKDPNLLISGFQSDQIFQLYDSKKEISNTNILKVIKSKDEATDAKLKDFLSRFKSNLLNKPVFIIDPEFSKLWTQKETELKALGVELLGSDVQNEQIFGILNPSSIKSEDVLKIEFFAGEKTIQRNELYTFFPPRKWERSDKISTVFLQGPSILGIKANEKEDKATRKFVKWLTEEKKYKFKFLKDNKKFILEYKDKYGNFTTDENIAVEMSPLEYLLNSSNYISPIKGFLNKSNNLTNPFSKFAFDEIKRVNENKDWSILEEPADELSNSFRNAVNAAFHGTINQYLEGTATNLKGTYVDDILPKINNNKSTFGL